MVSFLLQKSTRTGKCLPVPLLRISKVKGRNPNSIRLCTLLDKPERRVKDVKVDYCCFNIPDEFVVGYGLDYAQKYRNLPFIGVVELENQD